MLAAATGLTMVAGLLTSLPATAATAATAAGAATARADAVTPGDFGSAAARSADVAIDGWGDSAGYHVEVGRESGSFAWREVAILSPDGFDEGSWDGYQCLSGDGRFAAVAILPALAANVPAARDHGGFAYSVDLASGAVHPVAAGVASKYYSPGCGAGDTAVFTVDLGTDQQQTRLLTADLATGRVSASVDVAGQVTSAVPGPAGPIGVVGGTIAAIGANGKPAVLAQAGGSAFDLRPTSDGGVNFLSVAPGSGTSIAQHESKGVLTRLGSGPLTRMQLFGGRSGHAVLAGASATDAAGLAAAGVRAVDDGKLTRGVQASSLDGDALLGPATNGADGAPAVLAARSGKLVSRARPPQSAVPATAIASYRVPLAAKDFAAAPKGAPQPHGDAAAGPKAQAAPKAAAAAPTPTCSVPRLDAAKQVLQPNPAQVNWAAQMAEQGKLTGSAYTRPAGFDNLGLAAYAPNSDFPLIALSHPAGGSSTVPRSVYEAIMAQESNLSQASWHATKGVSGDPLIADYYGAGGGIDSINYAGADCGYGIGQVTSGMRLGDTQFSAHGQLKIAVDYEENIAAGLQILESTWNQLYADGITANGGDPGKLENWYFAVWAYNTGIQPNAANGNTTGCTPGPSCTGPDGTWGLGWSNNPANLDYPPSRDPYLKDTYADAAHPSSWPYQERVLGWMASPIQRYSSRAYSAPDYHGGKTWVQPAPFNTFCTVAADHCDFSTTNTSNPGAGHCMLNDFECWWHNPVTWISDCATTCATSAYEVTTGSTEPSDPDDYPPSCSLDTKVVPSSAIVVDDEPSPLNLVGCGSSNWSNNGTFTMSYGTNAAGDPIGAIDVHQLGSGLGGRVLFSHVESGAKPAEINTGTWTPVLPKLQYYKIKIHFPRLGARATNVVYKINPGGGVAPWKYRVNQAWNSEQWATVATVAMENGGNVQLTNQSASVATGSDYTQNDVAFDAIAFIPMGGTPGQPIGGPPNVLDEPKGSNPAWVNCGCVRRTAGDPVDTSTGYFGQSWTDLATPGRGEALAFSRTYTESTADPAGPNGAGAADGPLGWGWTYSYDLHADTDSATGNVTVVQEDGSRVGFVDSGGVYTTAAPRYDATLTESGSTYTYTRRGKDVFSFDAATGRLIAETDVTGTKANPPYATTMAYDASGHLSTITDPELRKYTLTWTGNHITRLADSAGRTVSYAYDAADNLTDVYGVGTTRTPTLKDDDHATFGYDAHHLMTSMRNPANFGGPASAQTSMVYDGSERVHTQTDALGHVTTFTYGPDGGLSAGQTLTTDPSGHQTLDTYAGGLLTAQTKGYGTADAGTWSYTYDPVTLGVTTQTDPHGNLTTYSYDDQGNRISTSDPRGYTTDFTYDEAGHLIETVDPDGIATVNQYDQADHVPSGATGLDNLTASTVTEANNVVESATGNFGAAPVRTTNYYYDDAAHPGDLNRIVDAGGHTTTVTLDAFGNKTSVTDAAGDKTRYGYDNNTGQLTSQVDPDGVAAGVAPGCTPPATGCTTYQHDAHGNVTLATDPLGHQSKAAFDADGNQVSTTDPAQHTTTDTYNAIDQLVATKASDDATTGTDYNPDGTIHDTVDGLGNKTTFGYDGQGRRRSRTDADNRTTTTSVDPGGWLNTVTDPQGRVTTMGYDAAGETTSITYSDHTTPAVAFTYDPDGNRLSMTDGTGTSTWSYNAFREVVSSSNGAGTVVTYGRDAEGHVSSILYPGQTRAATRTYDTADRLHTVSDWSGNTTTFGYDPDGAVKTTTYPNGTVVTNGYDGGESLTSIALTKGATTLASLGLGRNQNNEVSSATTGGSTQSFGYDQREQLASSGTTAADAYRYDAASNPTTVGGATQAFDAAGQICWSLSSGTVTSPACGTTPAAATAYTFDAEGDRTAAGGSTLTYDQAGRMTKFVDGAGTATTYQYDGTGLRASKTTGSTTASYVWDTESTADLLFDGTTSYLYGPGGLPIEQISGSTPSWFLHNQVGSTVALLDSTGAISGTYAYTPYGVATHAGAATTALQYTGAYRDAESGLIYLRARYYDPATAQFLTLDPMVSQTGTPYSYVSNDPLNGTDPSGQCGFWCWTGIGAAVVGTAACIILEPCGLVEGGGLALAGGGAAIFGATFTGGTILATGAAAGGLLGAGAYIMHSSSSGSDSGGSSSSSGSGDSAPVRADSGVKARPISEIPDSSGCEKVASDIQSRIGGEIYKAEPPAGASNLGPYRGEDSFWGNHEFVVKDGYAYDQWTGEMGEPLAEYEHQFEWWDVINFGPK